MVPFAGYELPVQYPDGVLKSHLHTRADNCASLFDVGHMGQIKWHGRDRAKFLDSLVVADVPEIKEGDAKLTLVTNAAGGIIDDSVITNHGSYIYMVVNGATKHGDMKHFDEHLAAFRAKGGDASYEYDHSANLVALQGPAAASVLPRLLSPADAAAIPRMPFMTGRPMPVLGVQGCIVTRCGYTGEDGFEIAMPAHAAEKITRALLDHPEVKPAGLGPRDSLRLEAGLCLYGHDIDGKTTPGEAGLVWTIGKRSRKEGGFIGAEPILKQLNDKAVARKRVGLAIQGAPAREGAPIHAAPPAGSTDPASAARIGVVTSGTFSPCLKAPIAMGYVPSASAAEGTVVSVEVRGKLVPAKVAKMPFVPARYFKPT